MEKVGKGAVMQADRDRRAGTGGAGETGGGKRWRQTIKGDRQRRAIQENKNIEGNNGNK